MTFGDRTDRIRGIPAPLHKQVAADIAADIASGRLEKNDMLPGEYTLGDSYDVSRVTIRNAVLFLRNKKLLTAVQGRGTFVVGTRKAAEAVVAEIYKSFPS